MAPPGIEPGLTQDYILKNAKKKVAPPGIEPGLTQDCTTTMCRHTTRPWHLIVVSNSDFDIIIHNNQANDSTTS
ncbi:hypothetical protein N7532_005827 [Penicillium argentinense]|uniref:Uncharacterized protein n=1 Tax=Penicillium argentinense TaxID=1131581 RepID=A0A9W9FER5_9EURO|nr:uncharacterized protein N7532_005827 [Penicillium argentinense]KAJ5098826.1 hypothetical protein N7532_005827 [Penicillium argentinense]